MTQLANAPRIPNAEILSTLGTGGMGKVYLARFSRAAFGFQKLLAVKVVRPERSDQAGVEAMFVDEARLVARIDHPSVAQVFDFGRSEGAFYLVMEYVQGCSLGHLLSAGLRPPPLVCAAIAARVCRGLHAAHELRDQDGSLLNVVHRDVTPSNLVLTFEGDVKILDFGIALMRARSAPVTGVGQIRGKPTYLAPEQVDGEAISRRTDIYALSIVLHELLTGEKLFRLEDVLSDETKSLPQGWRQVASQVRPPSTSTGPLPHGLDDVVMTGLAANPDDRFEDARAMAQALETVIAREGVESLAAYAEREMLELRTQHEAELRALLGGERGNLEESPHPGTQSAAGVPQAYDHATELQTKLGRPPNNPAAGLTTAVGQNLDTVEPPIRPRRTVPVLVFGLIAVAGIAMMAYLKTTTRPEEFSVPRSAESAKSTEPVSIEAPAEKRARAAAVRTGAPPAAEKPRKANVAPPATPRTSIPNTAKRPSTRAKRPPKRRPRRRASPRTRTRPAKRARAKTAIPIDKTKKENAPARKDVDIITEW